MMETAMTIKLPVVPVAAGALLRVLGTIAKFATRHFRKLAVARRHRAEARVLANLDRRMLSDIGITRADVRDAFSEPFWEDPTTLLRVRAEERRRNRPQIRKSEFRSSHEQAARQAC
jgi:uncharacterized protein YjiS (DUF1127 family)